LIGGRYPNLQQWDQAHMVFGWASYLYSSENATEKKEGHKLGVALAISVVKANKRIRFTYQGNDFGVVNWRGVSIYITTWDKSGEGNYHDIAEKQHVWTFGSGVHSRPKILDDIFIQLSSPSL
jgi:hypothetical protein